MLRLQLAMRTVFAAALLLSASSAFTQTLTTGDVGGVVTDSTGAVVPGANVTLKSTERNDTRSGVTNSAGQYRFSLLVPGDYTISAQTAGLKSNSSKFTVLVGQAEVLNLVLNVQGTQEVVEVSAEAALVQTDNANSATSFTIQQVAELPMAGGDLTTLAMTVPGVRVNIKGGSGNMNANGIPGSSILFTLNGADVMDPYNNLNNSGASNNLLGANEVAEAAVVLNAYSAQYGRMAGGQENIIGKSGTNSFHGNLSYNYNGQELNAKDFFVNETGAPKTRSDAHQYAAGGGGPIRKNKTFFFVDYEGLRYVLPATSVITLPSPQLLNYALAHVPAGALSLYQDAAKLYQNSPGYSRAVPVTNGAGPLQDSKGKLGCQSNGTFAGTPDGNGGVFGVTTPCAVAFSTGNNQLNTESLFIARVDQNLTDKQKINFRYEYDWGVQATGTSPIAPAFNSVSTQPQHAGQMNYSYVITPTLVNNFIGAASWYSAIFGVADFSKVQALMPERFSFGDGGSNSGGFTGVGSGGGQSTAGFPNGRNVGQAQLIDDLSWSKGKHTIKTGFNYRFNKVTATNLSSAAYAGTYTFNDLTDFANGLINSTGKGSSFAQSFPMLGAAHIRAYSLNFYAQDEWAVTRNLKLTYGMRFERDGNPACLDNCFARMNQQFGTPGYSGGIDVPYNSTITTGLHNAYQSLESIIPEPRFGFVYSPFGKTVIRGGVGLFANLFAVSVANNIDVNSPEVFSPSVTFGEVGLATDPNSSLAAAAASARVFESGFSQGYTLAQIQAALGKITFAKPSYYSPPNHFVAPKATEWSLEIEQPLTSHDVLVLTYAGNHGYDQALTNADANSFIGATSIYAKTGFGGLPLAAPDPRFLTVTQILTAGVSNYNSLTTQVRHAFSHGFQGQIGWVWSHALGNIGVYNPYNLGQGYSNEGYDSRHQITGDIIWNSPKLQNKMLNLVAGGWSVGTKLYIQTGPPFSATDTAIAAQINSAGGVGNTMIATIADPTVLGKQCTTLSVTGGAPCFTASQFATKATQIDFGNTGPNVYRGTGYFDVDTQLSKGFHIKERATFTLGTQMYNLLNHPNFANPSGSVTSSALGFISSTVVPPTSMYGSFQSGTVSGRVIVLFGKFSF
jgi:hypothetical protein